MTRPARLAPRWLWLTAELPAVRTTGRLVYSGGLISALAAEGIALTVVGLGAVPSDGGIDWIAVPGALRGGVRSLASPLPNLAYACAGTQMRRHVRAALAERWDVVVIDHLQMAWVAQLDELDSGRVGAVVFVTHNHEATVRREVARGSSGTLRRAALRFDAWKAARLERAALRRADVVTSITEADRALFERDAPRPLHIVLPPGWSGRVPDRFEPMVDRPRRVGVLGSFVWHVKQENLRRFVAAADARYADAGIELVVGGEVPDALRAELESHVRATRFVGWVDDAAAFLATCRIGLVAEPLGGGFKLKTLDYVFAGAAVAAVHGSVAGIPLVAGESLIEAADHDALATATAEVIDDVGRLAAMAASAAAACGDRFGWASRAEELVRAVDMISTRSH